MKDPSETYRKGSVYDREKIVGCDNLKGSKMNERVKDKVVMVTGGVSGLGLAGATRLAEEGARLIVNDIQDELRNAALERLRDYDSEALYLHQDTADEAQWKAVIEPYEPLAGLSSNAVFSIINSGKTGPFGSEKKDVTYG
jgi:NAD(P)-dependent dehydrogenase (short-subunit alcohol dehydrogenase family)